MKMHKGKDGKEIPINRLTDVRLKSILQTFYSISEKGYWDAERKQRLYGTEALIRLNYYDYLIEFRRRRARKDTDLQNLIKIHDYIERIERDYDDEGSPAMKAIVSKLMDNCHAEPTYSQLLDALDAMYSGEKSSMSVAQDLLIYAGRLSPEDAKVTSPAVPVLGS